MVPCEIRYFPTNDFPTCGRDGRISFQHFPGWPLSSIFPGPNGSSCMSFLWQRRYGWDLVEFALVILISSSSLCPFFRLVVMLSCAEQLHSPGLFGFWGVSICLLPSFLGQCPREAKALVFSLLWSASFSGRSGQLVGCNCVFLAIGILKSAYIGLRR